MLKLAKTLTAAAWISSLPAAAFAQASITGLVKDTSGAVLPGVTVEAASPALIAKTRTALTDGGGQYRIEILPPGTYSLTFTLAGFNTVKREGIELTGSFTATIDAELRVGAVEETVTVTGETPIVDVQSTTRQRVIDRQLIDNLPTGRTPFAMMVLIPGVTVAADNQDVGGATLLSGAVNMRVHGSSGTSQLLLENGLSTAALVTPSNSQIAFNMAATQEVAVDYSGAGADNNAAGLKMNAIPREGGNTFNGTLFLNGTSGSFQGNNFTEQLQDAGLRTPDSIRKLYDINPGFGGPLRRDKLWFYASGRYATTSRWAAGEFYDKNFNNANVWVYEPDLSRPVSNDSYVKEGRLRLTWQAVPRVKVGGLYLEQTARNFPSTAGASGGFGGSGPTFLAYEATPYHYFPIERQRMVDVTSPLTSRLLLDGAIMHKVEAAIRNPVPGLSPQMINVLEQSTNRQYRARESYINRPSFQYVYRASVSYITGAHSFKFGVGDIFGHFNELDFDNNPVSYRFNNGVPNLIAMRAFPINFRVDVNHQFGAYAQDRWTIRQLTLNAGLRFDWFKNSFPQQDIGPSPLAPARNVVFPKTSNLSLQDLNPKLGVAYDLFGDGKTALKLGFNRYVEQYTINGIAGSRNPINRLVNSTTRTWNDANRNFVPDCDLLNLAANGECGAAASRNFGSANPDVNFDPALLTGWGRRDYNWELTGGVQREIVRGMSADFSFFRRWYGNFVVTDNLAVAPSDYSRFDLKVPSDARLPGGGGYVVSGVHDLIPSKVGATDNYTTFADDYGHQINHFNGFALTVVARLPSRVIVEGGVDAGKTTTDNCDVAAKVPEILFGGGGTSQILTTPNNGVWTPLQFCHQESPFVTQVKLLGSYAVPRIDVQASATLQSIPGQLVLANYNAPSALVSSIIGRTPTAGANVSVEILEPGARYGERLNQLDLRFSKTLRVGRTKTTMNVDLYNALNVSTVMAQSNAFASWQRPQSIMLARFAKFGVQFDF